MLSTEQKTYLKNIYYDPKHEASFRGIDALYRFVKKDGVYDLDKYTIQSWLRENETYSTHVAKNRPQHWYGITAPNPGYQYDVDTGFFDFGDGEFKKFIVMVDVFSRKAAARPVKDLKARTVKQALQEMLDELGPVAILRSDRGTEYKNRTVSSMLKRRNIKQVFSFPPYKSAMAEAMIKQIKNRLYKILQSKGRQDWWKYLSKVMQSYNASFHRMLGMSPNQVTDRNVPELWYKFKHRRMKSMPPYKNYKYGINDPVRVALSRTPMEKVYNELNSTIVYFISHRYSRSHVHRYKLKDMRNKAQEGSYTENQLELTHVDQQTVWRIEKVIKYAYLGRGRNRKLYALCRWQNMGPRYDSYTLASNLVNLRDT